MIAMSFCPDLRAQCAQRALNRRGMVSKIIVNRHPSGFPNNSSRRFTAFEEMPAP